MVRTACLGLRVAAPYIINPHTATTGIESIEFVEGQFSVYCTPYNLDDRQHLPHHTEYSMVPFEANRLLYSIWKIVGAIRGGYPSPSPISKKQAHPILAHHRHGRETRELSAASAGARNTLRSLQRSERVLDIFTEYLLWKSDQGSRSPGGRS